MDTQAGAEQGEAKRQRAEVMTTHHLEFGKRQLLCAMMHTDLLEHPTDGQSKAEQARCTASQPSN